MGHDFAYPEELYGLACSGWVDEGVWSFDIFCDRPCAQAIHAAVGYWPGHPDRHFPPRVRADLEADNGEEDEAEGIASIAIGTDDFDRVAAILREHGFEDSGALETLHECKSGPVARKPVFLAQRA